MKKPPIRPKRNVTTPPLPNDKAITKAQTLVARQMTDSDLVDTGEPGATTALASAGDATAPTDVRTPDERHEQRMNWFYSECSRQAANRSMRARCEAFYDSEQVEQEEKDEIEGRGQKVVVYNEIKPTIDFLIGTERRSRVDFVVIAEDDDPAADEDAITKTKYLKYLEDVNRAPFERSDVADDKFKSGLGILEAGISGDPTKPPVFIGHVPWREHVHDSRAKKDQSDARFNFRVKLVDLDVALCLFPGNESDLREVVITGDAASDFRGMHGVGDLIQGLDSFDDRADLDNSTLGNIVSPIDLYNARERVMLIECWSREPQRAAPADVEIGNPISFKVRVSLMTERKTLLETWSPFRHDRFPFILDWAYRNKRTGMPYSPIFSLIGPQVGLNHGMSRAIFEGSFNQIELEMGAIDEETMNVEELRAEYNDPNGMPIFAAGALAGNKVRKVQNAGVAAQHVQMAQFNQNAIRQLSSVNEENRGLASSSTSRVAMDAKAERGSVGTAELFDMSLLARQIEGEIVLSLAEQFPRQNMTIRVPGEKSNGKYDRTKINVPQPDGSVLNDISARRAHFVIGEQAWKQSYAEAAFNSLMQVMTQLASAAPQVVVALLDVVFDMHPTLPRKQAVLERIREVNGQSDPDGKVTPEQQQARAQKAAVAKAQYEAQMAKLQSDIKKANAQGEKLDADAILVRVTALYEAAQAALVLAQQPDVTPIADQVLASAGFVDQAGSPSTIDPSQVQPIAQPQPGQPMVRPGGMPLRPAPALMQGDGAARGIETARPDGATQPPGPPAANQGAIQ